MSWTIKPNQFSKVVADDLAKLRTDVALYCLRSLVLRTPVDTGRARGAWNVSYTSLVAYNDLRTSGEALSTGFRNLATQSRFPYKKVIISNSLPYIRKLENGSSKQAPNGMVDVTVASARSRFRR